MCRLVGWVSREPLTLAEALGDDGLADLHALSRLHADGWGMAWWEGGRLCTTSSHLPAHSSADFAAAARGVRSDAALVHLRWATPGLPVRPENTHPFLRDDWAFAHNGAVRPAEGLLPLVPPADRARLRGDTDSERLMHVLLARLSTEGLRGGLRRTVEDVCQGLTPSGLNSLLLGRDALTALCVHGAPSLGEAPVVDDGPPEDQPGYFDLCWRQGDDRVVVASERLGGAAWERLGNGTALTVQRGSLQCRSLDVGGLSAAALAREQARRLAGTSAGGA